MYGPLRILERLSMHLKPFEVMIDCFGYCQFGRAFVFRQAKIGDDFSTKFLCLIEVKD